jgi:hypothetical protein
MIVDEELKPLEATTQRVNGARRQERLSTGANVRTQERTRWRALGVATGVAAVVVASAAPLLGYLRAPSGWTFTGVTTGVGDWAQHELWAKEMASYGHFAVNLLTPERTPVGWFTYPFDLVLGVLQAGTGIPYPVLERLTGILVIPVLAWGLLTIARRAGLPRPGLAVLVALLAGSLAPLALELGKLGLPGLNPALVSSWISLGGDATPVAASIWLFLALAVVMMVALLRDDLVSGFRWAGVTLLILGAVDPFFVPVLWLAGAFYAAICARSTGWRVALKGLAWFVGLSFAPFLYYGVVLPHIDPEYARFARLNHMPLLHLKTAVVSLGLGVAAILGIPRLVRGNRAQQLLGCLALAILIALYIPQYPWRIHLLGLSPLLVLGALAAWWPVVNRLDWRVKVPAGAVVLAVALSSALYYEHLNVRGITKVQPPIYLTSGDVAATRWLDRQPGDSVVLARSDISPWVAVLSGKRVIVGQYLWTHDFNDRQREVNAVFDGSSPRSLLETLNVKWVLVDGDRGVPDWAVGVQPAAQFGATRILRAADVLAKE